MPCSRPKKGIWHCITYRATLLGAVHDGALIPWTTTLDLFVRPHDIRSVLALDGAAVGLRFLRTTQPGAELALGSARVATFDAMRVAVFAREQHLGDLFAPSLFDDRACLGLRLRHRGDSTPHSSFPHFFVEEPRRFDRRDRVSRGRHAEQFVAGVYGDHWRTPYRSVIDGGAGRDGSTTHGDTFEAEAPRGDRVVRGAGLRTGASTPGRRRRRARYAVDRADRADESHRLDKQRTGGATAPSRRDY